MKEEKYKIVDGYNLTKDNILKVENAQVGIIATIKAIVNGVDKGLSKEQRYDAIAEAMRAYGDMTKD